MAAWKVKTPNVQTAEPQFILATPELWGKLLQCSASAKHMAGAKFVLVLAPGVTLETKGKSVAGRKVAVGETIQKIGRLEFRSGFEDIWLGNEHFDLRSRPKARLCIQFLVENQAFDAASAKHFTDEIDPFVRRQGDYLPSVEIKIDHYFNDHTGRLPRLRKDLIRPVGRNGKFYLKTD